MKVTVSFAETKIVVPCGDGSILIKTLAEMAACRFRKSAGSAFTIPQRAINTTAVESTTEATFEVLSPPVIHAIGEVEAQSVRHLNPMATIFVVEALMLAQDGGILDWDDCACEVIDDKELLLAKFKWDIPDVKPADCDMDSSFLSTAMPTQPASSWTPALSTTCIPTTPLPISSDSVVEMPEPSVLLQPAPANLNPVACDPCGVSTASPATIASWNAVGTTAPRRPAPLPPPLSTAHRPSQPAPHSLSALVSSAPTSQITSDLTFAHPTTGTVVENDTRFTPSLTTFVQNPSTELPDISPTVSTNEHETSQSVWLLRDLSQSKGRNANFNGGQKPPPPPPPITPASVTVSTIGTTAIQPTNPIVSHKAVTSLANIIGHPEPPPPPKRFPQTVLSGKPECGASQPKTTFSDVSTSATPPPVPTLPPSQVPPTKEASTVVPSPLGCILSSHMRLDQPTSINNEFSVLRTTNLLTQKHAPDSVKGYLLPEVAEHERTAAVDVVTFRRRSLSKPEYAVVDRPASAVASRFLPAKEEITIRLIKAASGLGFSLTTKDVFLGAYSASRASPTNFQSHQTTSQQAVHLMPIYGKAVCVKSIIPGGVALKDGSLRVGDRLLTVDHEDVSTTSQAQIVALLRVKPVGSEVELVVRRIKWLASTAMRMSTLKKIDSVPTYRTLSPRSSLSTCACEDCGPLPSHPVRALDDSHLDSHSEISHKCVHLKLQIPLLTVEAQPSTGGGDCGDNGNGVTKIRKNRLAAMRLGVSVREALPDCSSDSTSGIFVKSLIEGGAAYADGRLHVGDEILEVNGISLINTSNPLALLRAVLKHISLSPPNTNTLSDDPFTDQSSSFPVVSLLIARRVRHRRSASETPSFGPDTVQRGDLTDTADLMLLPINNGRLTEMPSYALRILADVHATSATAATPACGESISKSSAGGLENPISSPLTARKKRTPPNPIECVSRILSTPQTWAVFQTKKTQPDK